MTPVLIACSHGTSSHAGRAAISALVEKVRLLLPHVAVEEAFVDVQQPEIDDVVRASAPRLAVVVPLLLSTGFHTKVDIARAVTDAGARAAATAPLGPHPLLADLLAARLHEAGLAAGDAVVLAAAGSTDPAASVDVAAIADLLRERVEHPVSVGYAAGAGTRIDAAVAAARDAGATRVVAASYVLAPGFFADVIARAGADVVTAPLAPDALVAEVVVERYLSAAGALRRAA
ncbi:CbiX/SirB N-terminal domain-containing protein [Microbacterium oleivorans]|uniref:sirohydrochlorin chelatase n=1 Tax=Microbacterium TaxID=33882 RepID=UPI00203B1462|nr:CbiX/SirB N-terminal domain-containing protein [Microbacterium oleivorans]MCM3697726.1 sirohydrochlorin chelatase [Microbacterium oleivorans]